jgi:glutamine phosphoribosylpyrophosphate amidotransferase
VDTPTREELIASSKTPEQIREFLGADSLGYVSLANLKQAVNDTENTFCTSCYTGVYPTDLVQLEVGGKSGGSDEIFRDSTNGSRIEDPAAERPVAVEHES